MKQASPANLTASWFPNLKTCETWHPVTWFNWISERYGSTKERPLIKSCHSKLHERKVATFKQQKYRQQGMEPNCLQLLLNHYKGKISCQTHICNVHQTQNHWSLLKTDLFYEREGEEIDPLRQQQVNHHFASSGELIYNICSSYSLTALVFFFTLHPVPLPFPLNVPLTKSSGAPWCLPPRSKNSRIEDKFCLFWSLIPSFHSHSSWTGTPIMTISISMISYPITLSFQEPIPPENLTNKKITSIKLAKLQLAS